MNPPAGTHETVASSLISGNYCILKSNINSLNTDPLCLLNIQIDESPFVTKSDFPEQIKIKTITKRFNFENVITHKFIIYEIIHTFTFTGNTRDDLKREETISGSLTNFKIFIIEDYHSYIL